MKKTARSTGTTLYLLLAATLIATYGCGAKKATKTQEQQETYHVRKTEGSSPTRLITDYSGMQQHDIVSWFWIKPGVSLSHCMNGKLYPLQNHTEIQHSWAEKKIGKTLKELFSSADDHASAGIGIKVAIVELVPRQGMLKRWFPEILDFPYIEIEIIFYEEMSKKVLCKVAHYAKHEEFDKTVEQMTSDLQEFFKKES